MSAVLGFAVRPQVVLKLLGDLLVAIGVLSLVPLAVALGYGEMGPAAVQGGLAAGFVAAGFALRRLPTQPGVQRNEALAVVALAFLIAPLATAPVYVFAGCGWADALFEAISGVTTTGLSTLPTVEHASPAFLFTRAWTQWYGGLGIVVLALVLTSRSGLLARRLEPVGPEEHDLAVSTRLHSRRIARVYLILTAGGVALLAVTGMGLFNAFAYALPAVSTGGFAPHDDSLAALANWPQRALVMLLSTAGAISLPLYLTAWGKGWRTALRDPELRALVLCSVAVSALLALGMALDGRSAGTILRNAPLLGLSGQTTTGFAPLDVGKLSGFSKVVLAMSMMIGGSVGSTAGGIKLLRLLVIAKLVRWAFRRARLPEHALDEPRLADSVLDAPTLRGAVVVAVLFLLVTAVSWLVFLGYGYDPVDSLFEVVSATGTVGLSTGIARPGLEGVLKGTLCIDMLLGRLEIVAMLIVISPGTWFGRRATS